MTEAFPRIRHYAVRPSGESLIHREVLRLTLHLPFDHHDVSEQVGRALDVYLATVGTGPERFSEYSLGDEPALLDEGEGWERIRETLVPPRGKRFLDDEEDEAFVLRKMKNPFDRTVELLGDDLTLTGYGFFYWARLPWRTPPPGEMSLVSFSWPTEYLEARGSGLMREQILELASLVPYASGHAGLAFYSPNLYGPGSMKLLREEAFRHPGLEVTHGQRDLGSRVDGVHWLNFLGPAVLEAVGGVLGLRSRLHMPGTQVQALADARAVVTLGPSPEAGDLSKGRDLPAYRELARALEPWLYPCPSHSSWRGCDPEDPRRWWRRFLD